jgi:hypothetical protein
MKYTSKNCDQAKVNAELREMFGAEATRQDLLSYREKTGIDPKWIRRNPAARTGRGLYRIPGEDEVTPAFTPAPAATRKMGKHERAVLPTPFDDGAYDETPEVEETPKRGRVKESVAVIESVERPAPVFVHAWVCTAEACPGRKPGTYWVKKDDDLVPPTCECGAEMKRHSWAKRTRF